MHPMLRILFATALFVSLGARVVEAESGAARVEEAKRRFKAGGTHYRLGRFEEALAEYTEAYKAYARPEFLFNIGQCHRNLNDYERALYFFESYLEQVKDPVERKNVSDLITMLEALQEERRAEKEAREKQLTVTASAATKERAATALLVPVQALTTGPNGSTGFGSMQHTEGPPPKDSTTIPETWWFWTLVGAGVAALGTGIALAASGGNGPPGGSLGTFDYR